DRLTERLRGVDLRECDRQIERLVIGREDCKMHIQPLSPIEAVEIGVREGPRELASAISAEVEEDDTVAVLNPHDLAVPSDENRLDEFVRHIGIVARLQWSHRTRKTPTLALGEQVVGLPGSFPSLIAIHRTVAPDDR